MSTPYIWLDDINLCVEGHISRNDAERQEKTAREILRRLVEYPGLVLADEVGMGKTFVALAVAVSVALSDPRRRPVVVMVPPSLKEKWPRDFQLFCERCLPESLADRLAYGVAERPVEFLKFLDDPPSRRKQILFVTHGAMSRGLFDKWVKLALIRHAISGRHGVNALRKTLGRHMSQILQMESSATWHADAWIELLETPPHNWLPVMRRHGINPDGNGDVEEMDNPVPEAVLKMLENLDASELYETLLDMPRRRSPTLNRRITSIRSRVQVTLQQLWREGLQSLKLRLPLVVLDEAHHLKNRHTRLASLFQAEEARDDADSMERGALGGVFERMLFLTATPFQLGHEELCSVLDRFSGINWRGKRRPTLLQNDYQVVIKDLRRALDAAQLSALRLERLWGKMTPEDLVVAGKRHESVDHWWIAACGAEGLNEFGNSVLAAWQDTYARMREANRQLSPWVIRHLKPRSLPASGGQNSEMPRRQRIPGRGIASEAPTGDDEGLPIGGQALLPFLLAARAVTSAPDLRPVFAEGLASSYEAFLHTRKAAKGGEEVVTDTDDDAADIKTNVVSDTWYLDNLEAVLLDMDSTGSDGHPKLVPTVERVVDLWSRGEKVLVFCHYVATGRVLRQRISEAINERIMDLATSKLKCSCAEAADRLDRTAKRFDDKDSLLRRACDEAMIQAASGYVELDGYLEELLHVLRRFMRTPSFLVRYFPLDEDKYDEDVIRKALSAKDGSGLTLYQIIQGFLEFLAKRCGTDERGRYLEALSQLQTGVHYGADVEATYSEDEVQGERTEALLPNVRLVNGATKQSTRQRLMLTFNTPFYPEVLIASSVMAEGVDLHLSCRFVIHHDLCWNPSTLEQRTGRIDRIGAKCERSGQPVVVYLPYLGATQDEKMYRVVMDRERWFSVVMGEKYSTDVRSTDVIAERIPLPEKAASDLAFRLEVE